MSEVICSPTMPLEAETVSTSTTISETSVFVPIATETQMGVGYVATDIEIEEGQIDRTIHACGPAFTTPYQVKNAVDTAVDMLREETQTKIDDMIQVIKECWDNAFPSEFGQTGWQKLPNGLTMQWGEVDIVYDKSSTNTIVGYGDGAIWTFPIPFSEKPFWVGATPGYDTSGPAREGCAITDVTTWTNTQALIVAYSTSTNTTTKYKLFAIGVVKS